MRILNSAHLALLVVALAACDDEEEDCLNRVCPPETGSPPGLTLEVRVSPPPSGGRVRVEVYSGSEVESGTMITSWESSSGDPSRTLGVSEGDYSGHAMYTRPGDTLDAYDSDDANIRETTDDCDCHTGWFADDGTLDLREN